MKYNTNTGVHNARLEALKVIHDDADINGLREALVEGLHKAHALRKRSYSLAHEIRRMTRELAAAEDELRIKLMRDGNLDFIDPTTGKRNKDYTQLIIDHKLRQDMRLNHMRRRLEHKQVLLDEAKANLDTVLDQISAAKYLIRLHTAELNLLAAWTED